MAYNYLIGKADFAGIRDISVNVNETTRLLPYIKEAQEIDLKNILGNEFFYDILQEDGELYDNLLDGLDYTYSGYNYSFIGLKTILVYFAYARFIVNDDNRSTGSGFVIKNNEFSEHIDNTKLRRLQADSISIANNYIEDMKLYLSRFNSTYPKWAIGKKEEVRNYANLSKV